MTVKKITKTTLQKWDACADGYARFNKLFPKGATLKVASEGLIKDNHAIWADWLWARCKEDKDYCEQTVATAGYSGTATAGYRGTAIAGNCGTATAGNCGTAIAGNWGTATAGDSGTATAGKGGVVCLLWWNGSLYLRKAAEVDGILIKANTPYKLDGDGKFMEAK